MPDRGTAAPRRSFEAALALIAILIVGLALRLIIAYVLLPGSGFGADRGSFQAWANELATHGPGGFYNRGFFVDYTPGYLYVLWLVGIVGNAIGGIGDLIKLPPILADVVLAWLVHSLVRELGGSRRAALLGAAFVLVNPVTWFDSAIWGQVDAFGVIFLLLGLRDLWRRRPERATFFAVLAAVIKPQLGILLPILAIVLLRRHVWDRLRPPAPPAPAGAGGDVPLADAQPGPRGEPWLDRFGEGPLRLVTSAGVGLATAVLLCLPFGLSIVGLVEQVGKTAGGYPYITVNAYNPWALISRGGNGLAENGQWLRDVAGATAAEVATLIAGVPALYVGTALLLIVIAAVCLVVGWLDRPSIVTIDEGSGGERIRAIVDDRRLLLVALTVMAIAFFVVPTRVHERYLFPFAILGAILAATSVRWRVAYVLLSLANFANLYAVLLIPYFQNPGIKDWLGMADAIRSPVGVATVAAIHFAAFVFAVTELRPAALRRLDREAIDAALWEADEDAVAADATDGGWIGGDTSAPSGGPGTAGEAVAATTAAGGAVAGRVVAAPPSAGPAIAWDEASFAAERDPGWLPLPFGLARIRTLLPDRSRRLHGEGGGRLDRLDLWLLVVIVLVALVSRTFRLSEPYRMHFDEVYHARTATEFLQDWRYGMPHDIYEWTHPHIAKYAMAAGLIVAGDDRVTAQRSLGTTVRDVLVEPQWVDSSRPSPPSGDRFYVAGGDELRAYDLVTRGLITTWSVPGASALTLDPVGHRVLVGTDSGQVLALDTTVLDDARASGGYSAETPITSVDGPAPLADVKAPVTHLGLTTDASGMAVATSGGEVVLVDPSTGAETGRQRLGGVSDLADGGLGDGLTADPTAVTDPAAVSTALATITGGNAADYQARLTAATSAGEAAVVLLGGFTDDQQQKDISTAISDGRLTGLTVAPLPRIAVADEGGVTFISPATGQIVDTVTLDGAARGLTVVTGIDQPTLYAALEGKNVAVIQLGQGDGKEGPHLTTTFPMPGDVRDLVYDQPTQMVHVLGRTPDGTSDTIYVVEPHGNAVYADARLPFDAQAWALDANPENPSGDRQAILATSADGMLATVDSGNHAFAWRLPGMLAGALTAGLIFLLVRILFRRREIAVIAAILVLVDGMLFVQSRIAMNDVYVGLFIVAAYTLFAPLWLGRWKRPWAFWVVLPAVGVLLGFALASKWVGLYAMAGVVVLILGRSALGRILLILGLALGTAVLGYMAIDIAPDASTSAGNFLFVALMIALTLGAVLVTVFRPIAWSAEETRLAIVGPAAIGILVFLIAVPLGIAVKPIGAGPAALTPTVISLLLILGSGVVWAILRFAGIWGLGPLALPPDPDDPVRLTEPGSPPPEGWLRPGTLLGLPIVWGVICLAVVPIVVYVISYLPWVALGNRLTDTWPPGNTGQTLLALTRQMYDYHNGLRATHAASSPYWAWPLDLKPVWFYQDSFAANTSAAIYDAGNLVAWWLSIPAMLFVAWQAFKRRSLALGLVFVAFAFQWLPWARIDRATFQYHYYAAVPFLLIALAYFVAELRNGPSARTWALARVSAAIAVLGPALMWLFKGPLCTFVRVTAVNPGSEACVATAPGQIVLTWRTAGLAAILLVAGALLVVQILRLGSGNRSAEEANRRFLQIAATAVGGAIGLILVGGFLPDTAILSQDGFRIEPIALVVLIALSPIAWVVATARDSRRFAAGIMLACVVWFVTWYPNISGLPLPAAIVNAYQGLLPTYLYAFQFPVNTDKVVPFSITAHLADVLLLLAALLVTSVIVGYAAWAWRIAAAEREAARRDPGSIVTTGQAG